MPLRKKITLTLILIAGHTVLFAQTRDFDDTYRPKLAVKVNPLAFLAYTPGIELGLERAISDKVSIHLGGSYLSDFGIFQDKNFDGYKILGEYRIYDIYKQRHQNAFVGFHVNFKQTFASGETFMDRANGNFQQLTAFTAENTTLEFLSSLGRVYKLSPLFSLDLSLALGIKRLQVSSDELPPDAAFLIFEDNFLDFTVDEFGTGWYPLFRLHAKVNFEFK